MWARFAHPRQALGARLSSPRDGLTAEIALAVRPALVILSGTWSGCPLLIVSDDQVAAELAGIAYRQLATSDPEPIGPWEHPLVQHATDLDLGIAMPSQIAPNIDWICARAEGDDHAFRDWAGELLARIGVESRG
jgi:hypothetical protein